MTTEGVDYDFAPHPDPRALAAAGKHFACRYFGPGSGTKLADAADIAGLAAAGLAIVTNAEAGATSALGGYDVGVNHAKLADAHARSLGMPADRPIYFSLDWDVQPGDWGPTTVKGYLRGCASVIGLERVGVYGGLNPVTWAHDEDLARWFWQTYGWSHGVWAPFTHLQQYHNGVALAGATLDLNRAMQADFGQWMPGNSPGISVGGSMDWSDRFANPGAPGADATAIDYIRYGNMYAYQASITAAQALALVQKIAASTGVDPAELAAITAAAKDGAQQGVAAGAASLAAAVADELKGLNLAGLTPEQAEAAAETAVRKVLGAVDGATPAQP